MWTIRSLNNSPKINMLRLEKVMKRDTKIDQTYFLSETKTSTPMKSNHLKERIVFLPHPLSRHFGECTFPRFDSYDPADVCSENPTMFFLGWIRSKPGALRAGQKRQRLIWRWWKKQMFFATWILNLDPLTTKKQTWGLKFDIFWRVLLSPT